MKKQFRKLKKSRKGIAGLIIVIVIALAIVAGVVAVFVTRGGPFTLIGETNYTKKEAINMLEEANAKDATKMLAAQLIAAKLNRLSGTCSDFCHCADSVNVDKVIEDADEFLADHDWTDWYDLTDMLKNRVLYWQGELDAYNNGDIGPGHCDDR